MANIGHPTVNALFLNRLRLPILLVVNWRTEKTSISLSAFVPVNLVSRDGFGSPVPRQPVHLHTQAESDAYLRNSSRVPAVAWWKCFSGLLCSVGRCGSAPPPPPPGLLALHHKRLDDMDCSKYYRRKKSRERNCFNCRHLRKQYQKNLCWIPPERNKKCLRTTTTLRTTSPVPSDSRQLTPSVSNCVTR